MIKKLKKILKNRRFIYGLYLGDNIEEINFLLEKVDTLDVVVNDLIKSKIVWDGFEEQVNNVTIIEDWDNKYKEFKGIHDILFVIDGDWQWDLKLDEFAEEFMLLVGRLDEEKFDDRLNKILDKFEIIDCDNLKIKKIKYEISLLKRKT